MNPIYILGIESSCDDTSAAVIRGHKLLSNVIANQDVHREYGGVVPELASRAHQENIVPVVDSALKQAGIVKEDLHGIAFTRGPGLLGSLLVGTAFAKGMARSLNIPMMGVNHLRGHVLSHFLEEPGKPAKKPEFPFLCMLVSGGHTQFIVVHGPLDMELIGSTIDDAAGEAFDKTAKIMGLPYPGGPVIDKYAQEGDPDRFEFAKPRIDGLDVSYSGLKTSILYFLRDELKKDPAFIKANMNDLCASIQRTIIEILTEKLLKAVAQTGIRHVAIGGGVAANSGLRNEIARMGKENGWQVYIPERRYTTDNAAMIAVAGYFQYQSKDFAGWDVAPLARMPLGHAH